MVALFFHVDFILTSWYVTSANALFIYLTCCRHYIWASLALYGTVYLFRIARTLYNSGLALTAHVSLLPSGPAAQLLRVRIAVPTRVSWRPGQHVFLRFWGLGFPHAFSSHPWTVANIPSTGSSERAMELVMRVKGGVTRTLSHRAEGKTTASLSVWVDGPYGGVPGGLDAYDDVLLLAGGSGMSSEWFLACTTDQKQSLGSTFVIPLLAHLVQRKANEHQSVQLLVAIRNKG